MDLNSYNNGRFYRNTSIFNEHSISHCCNSGYYIDNHRTGGPLRYSFSILNSTKLLMSVELEVESNMEEFAGLAGVLTIVYSVTRTGSFLTVSVVMHVNVIKKKLLYQ